VIVQVFYDTVLNTESMQRRARCGRMILNGEQGKFAVSYFMEGEWICHAILYGIIPHSQEGFRENCEDK
jgi:hypothetical protein